MIEAENEIFDDYYEGPRGIAGEIYFANDGDVVKIEPDTYYEVLHLEDLQNLTLDFTGVELLTKEDVTIFTLENCSNIKIIGLTIRHDMMGCLLTVLTLITVITFLLLIAILMALDLLAYV
ncbi:MAG: hypothetical protein CM15mP65_28570 [Crocinitomicaceae bacterium]|nr:MAG: hypothetical protein CM15mP65_28570 [Crocinitomicaceae bacterium]